MESRECTKQTELTVQVVVQVVVRQFGKRNDEKNGEKATALDDALCYGTLAPQYMLPQEEGESPGLSKKHATRAAHAHSRAEGHRAAMRW